MTRKQRNLKNRCNRYGITPTDYWDMWKKQKNRCAICKCEFSKDTKDNIDHSHAEKFDKRDPRAVRGLLCMECNTGLGKFQDNSKVMLRGISYILNHKTRGVFRPLVLVVVLSISGLTMAGFSQVVIKPVVSHLSELEG